MLCEKYQELSTVQQIIMVGQIVHALQNDNGMFAHVKNLIDLAALKGIYENVTILPNPINPEPCNNMTS